MELGLRSSFGSLVPECHATLRGTPECFLCLDGCCRLLLKLTRSPSRREAEPRASWRLAAAGHLADICPGSLGSQAICVRDGGRDPGTLPRVPTGGGLSAVITASKETADTRGTVSRLSSPEHRLVAWETKHLAGEAVNWSWCQAGSWVPHPT